MPAVPDVVEESPSATARLRRRAGQALLVGTAACGLWLAIGATSASADDAPANPVSSAVAAVVDTAQSVVAQTQAAVAAVAAPSAPAPAPAPQPAPAAPVKAPAPAASAPAPTPAETAAPVFESAPVAPVAVDAPAAPVEVISAVPAVVAALPSTPVSSITGPILTAAAATAPVLSPLTDAISAIATTVDDTLDTVVATVVRPVLDLTVQLVARPVTGSVVPLLGGRGSTSGLAVAAGLSPLGGPNPMTVVASVGATYGPFDAAAEATPSELPWAGAPSGSAPSGSPFNGGPGGAGTDGTPGGCGGTTYTPTFSAVLEHAGSRVGRVSTDAASGAVHVAAGPALDPGSSPD